MQTDLTKVDQGVFCRGIEQTAACRAVPRRLDFGHKPQTRRS